MPIEKHCLGHACEADRDALEGVFFLRNSIAFWSGVFSNRSLSSDVAHGRGRLLLLWRSLILMEAVVQVVLKRRNF